MIFEEEGIRVLRAETRNLGGALPKQIDAEADAYFQKLWKTAETFMRRYPSVCAADGTDRRLMLCLGMHGSGVDDGIAALRRERLAVPVYTDALRQRILSVCYTKQDADNDTTSADNYDKKTSEVAERRRKEVSRRMANALEEHQARPNIAYACMPSSVTERNHKLVESLVAAEGRFSMHLQAYFGPIRDLCIAATGADFHRTQAFEEAKAQAQALWVLLRKVNFQDMQLYWRANQNKPAKLMISKDKDGCFIIHDRESYGTFIREMGNIDPKFSKIFVEAFGEVKPKKAAGAPADATPAASLEL